MPNIIVTVGADAGTYDRCGQNHVLYAEFNDDPLDDAKLVTYSNSSTVSQQSYYSASTFFGRLHRIPSVPRMG